MESKLKHTTELNEFPIMIRKKDQAKYIKYTFKPKFDYMNLYGFWRTPQRGIDVGFKLCIRRIDAKNYLLKINKRVEQTFQSMKTLEIQLKDNQAIFTINEESTIPLFIMKVQYFIIESDNKIKYYENIQKKH